MATSCDPQESALSIAFGTILATGVFCSYISQHVKIFVRRSATGLSWTMLLIANISSWCALLNVVVINWPSLKCCNIISTTPKQCYELILPILQIGMPSINLIAIYSWFLLFFEQKEVSEDVLNVDIGRPSLRWWRRLVRFTKRYERFSSRVAFLGFIVAFVFCLSLIGGLLIAFHGDWVMFSRVMGALSAITNMFQWTPQIITTLRSKQVGSLSVIMLALQVPGGYLLTYFNLFIAQTDVSTWGPFLLSSTQQLVLLIICIVYTFRDWRKARRERLEKAKTEEIEPLVAKEEKSLN